MLQIFQTLKSTDCSSKIWLVQGTENSHPIRTACVNQGLEILTLVPGVVFKGQSITGRYGAIPLQVSRNKVRNIAIRPPSPLLLGPEAQKHCYTATRSLRSLSSNTRRIVEFITSLFDLGLNTSNHSEYPRATDQFRKTSGAYAGPLGLNVIYTPDNGHKVDIVFVHGLGGTSRWTWLKYKNPELFWSLTFLPLEPDVCP